MVDPKLWNRIRKRSVKDKGTGCLVWQGASSEDRSGVRYGSIRIEGKSTGVHRAAYIAANGDIPDGLQIDHLCFNTLCVNPDHIEAVTQAENIRRSRRVNTTVCKRGHPLDGIRMREGVQVRYCKRCHRAATLQSKRRISGDIKANNPQTLLSA